MRNAAAPLSDRLNDPHLLVVDDDRRIRELVARYLDQNGFLVTVAENADMARQLLKLLRFDAVILDIMMPGETGLELAQSLRTERFETPIIFLTAKGEAEARIAGLEAGADDYLPKPFEPRELVLRLNAIFRRQSTRQSKEQKSIGGWVYDDERTLLLKDEQTQSLTRAEGNLLTIFLQKPRHIFSRQELAQLTGLEGQERTVDVQVTRLRRKIEPDPKKPRFLQTVRGEGYILHVD